MLLKYLFVSILLSSTIWCRPADKGGTAGGPPPPPGGQAGSPAEKPAGGPPGGPPGFPPAVTDDGPPVAPIGGYGTNDEFTLKPLQEQSTVEGPPLTDIPQSAVDEALILEIGEYSTMKFDYINDQFVGWQNASSNYICYDDFMRCIATISIREPVCAAHISHTNYQIQGYMTLPSICTLFFDNCRRRLRYWYMKKQGACAFVRPGKGVILFINGKK